MSATDVLKKDEERIANLPEGYDLPNNITNKKMKDFINPLETQIKTLEVENKTVEGYFSQISHNWYIGAKATYFIARDIYKASTILTASDYELLKESITPLLSRSTLDKYAKIGVCERLANLLLKQALPMTWTTQYRLACLSEEDYAKVLPILQSTTTMQEINRELGVVADERPKRYSIEKPKEFISIAFEAGTGDPNKMQSLINKIQDLVVGENSINVKYSTSKTHKDFKCEMWFNHALLTETENKVVEYYEELHKKKSPHKDTFAGEYAKMKKLSILGIGDTFEFSDNKLFDRYHTAIANEKQRRIDEEAVA